MAWEQGGRGRPESWGGEQERRKGGSMEEAGQSQRGGGRASPEEGSLGLRDDEWVHLEPRGGRVGHPPGRAEREPSCTEKQKEDP